MQLDEGTFGALLSLSTLVLSHNTDLMLESDGRSFQGIDDSLWHLGLANVSLTSVSISLINWDHLFFYISDVKNLNCRKLFHTLFVKLV